MNEFADVKAGNKNLERTVYNLVVNWIGLKGSFSTFKFTNL